MRYLLMISADEQTAQQQMAEGDFASFEDWYADLERRGVLEVHVGLHDSRTATTVRVRDGRDLDEAIEIAAGHPATNVGQVEIRPVR
jgi:hypothetical protein